MTNHSTKTAGVDEAGRGPLAGPVYAAAVIFHPHDVIDGVRDSKQLSASKREYWAQQIRERAFAYAVSYASVEEIDRLNILQATFLAMTRALEALPCVPDRVLIDGNRLPKGLPYAMEAVVGGDRLVAEISAASVLAKVARDAYLLNLDKTYPQYGFAKHKGYPTAAHCQALREHGVSVHHRRSFAPVRAVLETEVF